MMLSDTQIRERIENEELGVTNIEDLDEQLSPSGIDLRVASDYTRPATGEVFDATEEVSQRIRIRPGEFYLLHTVESLIIPDDLHAETSELMSRALEGVSVACGVVDPGYSDTLVLGVNNRSEESVLLRPGDKIVQVTFQELGEPAESTYDSSESSLP